MFAVTSPRAAQLRFNVLTAALSAGIDEARESVNEATWWLYSQAGKLMTSVRADVSADPETVRQIAIDRLIAVPELVPAGWKAPAAIAAIRDTAPARIVRQ